MLIIDMPKKYLTDASGFVSCAMCQKYLPLLYRDCNNDFQGCLIKGELPEEHGDLVDYDEVEKEFNRLLTYMEEVPDENGVIWFRRETIIPRGYTMKFHTIIPAERK